DRLRQGGENRTPAETAQRLGDSGETEDQCFDKDDLSGAEAGKEPARVSGNGRCGQRGGLEEDHPSYEERSAAGDLPQISGGGKADRQYVSKRCRLCNDERQRTDSIRFRPKRKTGGTSL